MDAGIVWGVMTGILKNEEEQPLQKLLCDPRTTPVGK